MPQELFRREAIEAQTRASHGSVRLATPVSFQVWAGGAFALAFCLATWLFVGHYTRRERVVGRLVPQAGLLVVNAQSAGVITKFNVKEGAVVRAGDPLLTISADRSSASMGDTAAAISTQLHSVKERLEAAIARANQIGEDDANYLRVQQLELRAQLKQIDVQVEIERRQVNALSALLDRFKALGVKGYVSALDIQQQHSQELEAEERVRSLLRERAQTEGELGSIKNQLVQLPLATAEKLNELQRQISQNAQDLAENEAERALVIRAPESGVISAMLLKQGQAVANGQPILAIMPRGSRLQAQLLVPSDAIGFVHQGTRVILHYHAFPYQKFGVQYGTVISVSQSALTPNEVMSLLGQQPPEEAVYQVSVQLVNQRIRVYGRQESLKPGMTLFADLLLDRRRMMEWIFEPLYGMAARVEGDD